MTDAPAETVLQNLIEKAKAAGATAADAVLFASASSSVTCRLGKVEETERSESQDLGLRVLVGQRQAVVSSSDHAPDTLNELAERAVAMAKLAPEDPYAGLAPKELLSKDAVDLDLFDPAEPTMETLTDRAKAAEDAALSVKGVTNSSGADAGWGRSGVRFATSDGFYGAYETTSHSVSCSVLAGEGDAMERDYDYATALHGADLSSPEEIGRTAGERTVRRLNPKRVKSQSAPVVYENRLARSLVRHLAGAVNGGAIARKVSFLKDKMGDQLFSEEISIVDDPHVKRGLGSAPYDGEGVANAPIKLIDQGRLTSWIMNSSQARQLGLTTNGRAARGSGGPPGASTTNLTMAPGTVSFDALISDIKQGLLITDMFGPSVNSNTGDYSVGVSGFWIENGARAYPVSELTVAGNILDMFKSLTPADDLEIRSATNAPSVRIEGMTIGGE